MGSTCSCENQPAETFQVEAYRMERNIHGTFLYVKAPYEDTLSRGLCNNAAEQNSEEIRKYRIYTLRGRSHQSRQSYSRPISIAANSVESEGRSL